MQGDFSKEFLPLVSKTNWVITWLMNIFGGAVLLVMFLVLAVFPFLVSGNIRILAVIGILYYPVWAIGIYSFFGYVKNNIRASIKKIMVDDKGIHFYKKDGSIDEILYSQLGKTYFSDQYDVYLSQQQKSRVLTVGIDQDKIKIVFDGTHLGSVYYVSNARALRARFIEGIVRFRPDLEIDPLVFEEFSIHPEKFIFDGKQYRKHIVETVVISGIILLISCLFVVIVIMIMR